MKKTRISKSYTHFAVNKETGKIYDGWDYKDVDKESIAYYYKIDAKDNDYDTKIIKLVDALTLFKKGVNPYDADNWHKFN